MTSTLTHGAYVRSLFFVLYKAVSELYPECRVQIDAHVSNGFYCHLAHIAHWDASAIRQRMQQIIEEDLPFERHTASTPQAIRMFDEVGQHNKALLLASYDHPMVEYHTLGGTPNYFYGDLLSHTSQLTVWGLEPYDAGLLLRVPSATDFASGGAPQELLPFVPQPKMLAVFREYHRWAHIMDLSTVGELNHVIASGSDRTNEMINVSECLQERKISGIADHLASHPEKKVVLIAGPSSSGKTTFSKRLSVQLLACGMKPVAISLDNYFVDRVKTPLDEDGNYDYESIHAMQIDLFNEQMTALLKGEEVELPYYNFKTGKSERSGQHLRLTSETVLILEGIHALNPLFSAQIPDENKYRVYASALTSILLDDHNYIPTTDNRLLRRLVRDYKFRGYSAEETIRRWPAVRKGEERWLFPYQEEADMMINTALLFELSCLKEQALPLLQAVPRDTPERPTADRLISLLSYLRPIPLDGLPPTSLLREFMGGSTFSY